MTKTVERLISRRDKLRKRLEEVDQLIRKKMQRRSVGKALARQIMEATPPEVFPFDGTWSEKCYYILKEAKGAEMSALELMREIRKHYKGKFSLGSVMSGLDKLRKSSNADLRCKRRKTHFVYWLDLKEPDSNSKSPVSLVVDQTHPLPEKFAGLSIADVFLPKGVRVIRIIHPDGSIDKETRKVKSFLRRVISELELDVELLRPNGKYRSTRELGRAVLSALRAHTP
jgi:hypothetical protein